MAGSSSDYSCRRWARLVFLLLLVIPFIPEIVICAAAGAARLVGCQPDQQDVCLIGSVPVSDIIGLELKVGAPFIVASVGSSNKWFVGFFVAVCGWLMICYVALLLGWARLWIRLFLGLVVMLVFAVLPYFGPMLAVGSLTNDNCEPNEGGVGSCVMFGGHVGTSSYSPVHDAVALGWLLLIGAPLAFGVFVIYVIAVISLAAVSAKRGVRSA